MFVMRETLQCKPGKIGDLKKRFQALNAILKQKGHPTFVLLTDVAGEHFWTLVLEMESDSLDGFFAIEAQVMSDPEAQQTMAGYHDLIASGRREVFRKVA